jgi:hypothetical protein
MEFGFIDIVPLNGNVCASALIAFIPLESFVKPLNVMFPESKVGGYEGSVILIKGATSSLGGNRLNLIEETCTKTITVIPTIMPTEAILSHFGDFFLNNGSHCFL